MNYSPFQRDALQANLGFLVHQLAYIEPGVYRHRYPDLDYASIIPVDTSANPWVKTVTFFSMNGAGQARWLSGNAMDIPTVGFAMDKFESAVHSAGIGYEYGNEELEQARMAGIPITNEKAMVARRVYEEFVYGTIFDGSVEKGMSGILNYPGIATDAAPADGTAGASTWASKTPAQILRDFNNLLVGIHTATNTIAAADTVLLPWTVYLDIATRTLSPDNMTTILNFLRTNNAATAQTGNPITIRALRGLDTAGAGATARAAAYRRSPEVLKVHIPMPHRFFPPQVWGFHFYVPGMFRLGGVDVRLPSEVRYLDGI